jgi:16S rRNA processing protein RimM
VASNPFVGVTVARVLRPWGRRGQVAAEILTDFPHRLTRLGEVWLFDGRNPPRRAAVVSCRLHLGQAIFHFSGSESISAAERLRGLEVQVPLSARAPLGSGRYYVSDLVGCGVFEPGAAVPLGQVRAVEGIGPAASQDTPEAWHLVVATPHGELLIPLAAEICTRIDPPARSIEVRLPEGLRELNSGPAERV